MSSETETTKDIEGDFYEEAIKAVREHDIASTSRLQRKFMIGYNRAARLLEAMQEDGIITDFDSRGVRTVISKS